MPASPDPDLTLQQAKATLDLYAQAVQRLLELVAQRLARGITEPGWAERKLLEMAALRDQAAAVVDRLTVLGPPLVEKAVTAAYEAGVAQAVDDLTDLAAAGVRSASTSFARTHTRAVAELVREAVTKVRSTHLQILRSTVDAYRQVIEEVAAPGVVSGVDTRRQAAQRALDRFATDGITGFVDVRGRRWEMESYAEMAVRTSVGRAQVAGTLDRFTEAGRDLVIVSDSPQECEVCRPWEGKVLSISGADPDHASVATATAAGLLHANCRHRLAAFIPGLTRPLTNTADPEGDRARQEQRRLERGVRAWKRRAAVALDDQTRARALAHAREWQARLREHVAANDLKRRPERERLGAR